MLQHKPLPPARFLQLLRGDPDVDRKRRGKRQERPDSCLPDLGSRSAPESVGPREGTDEVIARTAQTQLLSGFADGTPRHREGCVGVVEGRHEHLDPNVVA